MWWSNERIRSCNDAIYSAIIKEINRTLGITILLITHEMEVVKQICDQVAVIDQGRLVEQGTVGEILQTLKQN